MKAIRHSTLQKALEFHRAGGVVIALGALPEASDRIGRDDPEVIAMVQELSRTACPQTCSNDCPTATTMARATSCTASSDPGSLCPLQRAKEHPCFFRATGKVELWDPWTGSVRPLAVVAQTASGTKLKLPLTEKEIQLIVFSPGQPQVEETTSSAASNITKLLKATGSLNSSRRAIIGSAISIGRQPRR